MDLPWETKKFLIRGLFDTDGTIFAKKNEGYRYPYIGFTSKNKIFLKQVQILLRKKGYPFYTNNDNLFMKGIKNIKKWMKDVGTSNSKHKFKYEYWTKHGKLPAGLRASSSTW
ncbi:LAGLIDADG family homing endonuclease [Candidatus Woesearchaeota archaeon]|nr:LAGLIDADG family homing endonuclease [Candidatus Woesearchaeota archaeon]